MTTLSIPHLTTAVHKLATRLQSARGLQKAIDRPRVEMAAMLLQHATAMLQAQAPCNYVALISQLETTAIQCREYERLADLAQRHPLVYPEPTA